MEALALNFISELDQIIPGLHQFCSKKTDLESEKTFNIPHFRYNQTDGIKKRETRLA